MYRVEAVGEDVDAAIEALSYEFMTGFHELQAKLRETPWDVGRPYVAGNPRGSRTATFGPENRGLVLYAVHDRDRLVVLWQVAVVPY
jgi:hypothetical protein